ncbi:hypothetical protein C2S53_018428 [Perilla frutescens var. hirtella]|uniref:GDSL esterase/lipase n=1 Tax=Perilla frutescens var. hirtella TaxID=608512 RepID=A0AAD4NZ19_PERFH|nr:hypothetical protein C2S53_018428 [Perilla frutescens var. hirtella]
MDAGIPLLPPYRKRDADFSEGINFAVGGSTALAWDELVLLNISSSKTNTSLSMQLDEMAAYFYSLCNHDVECGERFRDALFILGPFGGSDYYEALFQGKTIQEIRSKLVPKVVDAIMAGVRRVIGFGAKKVVVPGLYSIYRLPLFQTIFAGNPDMYTLSEDLAYQHNSELRSAIDKLKEEERRNAAVAFEDYAGAYSSLDNYALGRMHTSTCCGSGGGLYNFDLNRMCGESGVSVCGNPDQHISWDGLHLTQEAYRILSKFMLYHFFVDLHCPQPQPQPAA